ncbi:hypothetical protein IscW_ISCW015034 [Ixodes scapularis]|uniref:Uncharacterized protein n=1 Tax=Ixodes scapularis TaxID=6945 RepID=B7QGZ8_IXOSC|nr:hypothetical protein IscW_ISCW015034 [Ixodes scapularis]|eukprot:XP_002414455.1 hypothetical protein IscW_ISCW015034 [Ixodes scapularis]
MKLCQPPSERQKKRHSLRLDSVKAVLNIFANVSFSELLYVCKRRKRALKQTNNAVVAIIALNVVPEIKYCRHLLCCDI